HHERPHHKAGADPPERDEEPVIRHAIHIRPVASRSRSHARRCGWLLPGAPAGAVHGVVSPALAQSLGDNHVEPLCRRLEPAAEAHGGGPQGAQEHGEDLPELDEPLWWAPKVAAVPLVAVAARDGGEKEHEDNGAHEEHREDDATGGEDPLLKLAAAADG